MLLHLFDTCRKGQIFGYIAFIAFGRKSIHQKEHDTTVSKLSFVMSSNSSTALWSFTRVVHI